MREVDALTVAEALGNEAWFVIDTRSSSAYMGWRLEGEEKSGHIKGATDFSAAWITYKYLKPEEKEKRLLEKLELKGIDKESNIILYDVNRNDAEIVAEYFRNHGISNLFYFNFLHWNGEVENYPGYRTLVPVQWVKQVLDGERPEHFEGNGFKIFELSWGNPTKAFLEAHIPTSVHIDTEEYERGEKWVRPSDPELEQFACDNGITVDTAVILYGMDTRHAASKCESVLHYMGVKHVYCLNGTMLNWLDAGYPTESGNNPKIPTESYGGSIPQHPEEMLGIDDVREILRGEKRGQIVDMRPWRAYIGEDTEYSYVPVAGRIPGSIWCYDKYYYGNPDSTMTNAYEMLEAWKNGGIDLAGRPVFLCGSGAW